MSASPENRGSEQSTNQGNVEAEAINHAAETHRENDAANSLEGQAVDGLEQALQEEFGDPLAQLRAEAEEAGNRALRAQAELENVRKRMQRDILDERRYAAVPLIRDLLVVADNVDRAVAAAQQANEDTALLDGFQMVAEQLHATLEKHGCKQIEADGQPFDPHLHEAISQQPCRDRPPGTVMQVVLNGYQLHDRVIRPAQVIVSHEPTEEASPEPATNDEE